MIVYVLSNDPPYDSGWVKGVFSTAEKAKAVLPAVTDWRDAPIDNSSWSPATDWNVVPYTIDKVE